MFIRRTQTRSRIAGEPYVTYRLVHSQRVGNAIEQTTVLNLGSHFDLPPAQWPALAQRIDELLRGQRSMPPTNRRQCATADSNPRQRLPRRAKARPPAMFAKPRVDLRH